MKSSPKKSSSVPQINEKYESFNKIYSDINNFLHVEEFNEPHIPTFQCQMNNMALVGEYDRVLYGDYIYSFKERDYEVDKTNTYSMCTKVYKLHNFVYNKNLPEHKDYLRMVLKKKDTFILTEENDIKKYYPHIWSRVTKYYGEWAIWSNESGNKFKLTHFERKKTREVLNPYFNPVRGKKGEINRPSSLTVHLDTGNIYTNLNGILRCNDFKSISRYLMKHDDNRKYTYSLRYIIHKHNSDMLNGKNYYFELYFQIKEKFSDFKIKQSFCESELFNLLINFFFYKKGIECTKRNFYYFLKYYPGTKRKNKKYFNMEEELLKKQGLNPKNKYLRNLVTNGNVHFEKLKWFVIFFGDDYAKFLTAIKDPNFFYYQKNDDILSYHRNINNNWGEKPEYLETYRGLMTKKVKQNIIKIINTLEENDMERFKSDLLDHLRMLEKIKVYFPDEDLNAQSHNGFNQEHLSFSVKERMIRNPFTTHYLYRPETLKIIEEPITTINENGDILVHYPFILKTDNDYIEEGSKMRHCVGGYTHKESSIIISLRNEKATERVTCEYHISDGSLIQERSVSNGRPPEEFVDALAILFTRVNQLASYGKLNWEKKEVVPNVVNGIEVKIPETLTRNNLLF